MAPHREIFRQVALERISSPEQLDAIMHVTNPRSWIALIGLLLLLTTVVVWGFVGSIPTKVSAQGILIQPGGVFDVFSTGAGPITDVLVTEGDRVEKGQVLARIDQPALTESIDGARAELAELTAEHEKLRRFAAQDLSLRDEATVLQEAKLKNTIAFAEERLLALDEQTRNLEALLEKGLITKQTLLEVRQEYFSMRDLLTASRNELNRLPIDRLSERTTKEREVVRSQMAISDLQRRIEALELQHRLVSEVVSPYSGRILEVKKKRGDVIGAATPLLSLQLAGKEVQGLQAVIYVSPTAGKNVEPGQRVEISPTTAPRAEYGYMLGTVTYVSEFPATSEGMMRVLSNVGLVTTLSTEGPPFAVYADLIPDARAASGYRWSSPKGAALKVNSGTLCSVTMTVRSRRPVELVIPALREWTGL